MKTKTLLLAGLVCAASAVPSMAQVFSLNAVGFVNITVVPGFNMIANPLNADGTNGLDTIMPTVPKFCQLFKFNPNTGSYDVAQRGTTSWASPLTASPGEGFFFKNPYTTNIVLTFTGSINQGTLTTPLPAGFSMASSQVPQSGLLATDLGFPAVKFDQVFTFDPVASAYNVYQVQSVSVNGGVSTATWSAAGEPLVAIGQGFFVRKVATTTWTRTFSVNN